MESSNGTSLSKPHDEAAYSEPKELPYSCLNCFKLPRGDESSNERCPSFLGANRGEESGNFKDKIKNYIYAVYENTKRTKY